MDYRREEFLSIAIHAARSAGSIIMANLGSLSPEEVGLKEASDFVTRVDRESEETIIRIIRERFPEHRIMAEESLKERGDYRWIIDPLDGTTNYIHSFPVFAVSIGLEHRGEMITGVVFDPLKDELFTAEKGKGAFLNGRPIRVSAFPAMEKSLVTTGFPFKKKALTDTYLDAFKRVFLRVSDLRRAGAAALDLAYVAAGRCEAFFELGLSPWDMAAGCLIIQEAGGVVTDFGGGADYLATGNIVAGAPAIHREILAEVRSVFKGLLDT